MTAMALAIAIFFLLLIMSCLRCPLAACKSSIPIAIVIAFTRVFTIAAIIISTGVDTAIAITTVIDMSMCSLSQGNRVSNGPPVCSVSVQAPCECQLRVVEHTTAEAKLLKSGLC